MYIIEEKLTFIIIIIIVVVVVAVVVVVFVLNDKMQSLVPKVLSCGLYITAITIFCTSIKLLHSLELKYCHKT